MLDLLHHIFISILYDRVDLRCTVLVKCRSDSLNTEEGKACDQAAQDICRSSRAD